MAPKDYVSTMVRPRSHAKSLLHSPLYLTSSEHAFQALEVKSHKSINASISARWKHTYTLNSQETNRARRVYFYTIVTPLLLLESILLQNTYTIPRSLVPNTFRRTPVHIPLCWMKHIHNVPNVYCLPFPCVCPPA